MPKPPRPANPAAFGNSAVSETRKLAAILAADVVGCSLTLGRIDEAKATLAEAQHLNPKLTVKWMVEHMASPAAVHERLRKAGLPENERGPEGRGELFARKS